jgi:hypothetical protein
VTCSATIGRIVALLTGISASVVGPALARAEPAAAAHAAPASRVRLLVLGSASEFAARVGGQLSDLDVVLQADTPPSDADAPIEDTLAALAARHEADVVAWLAEAPLEAGARAAFATHVHIWIAGREQVYSRRIAAGTASRGPPRSASTEYGHSGALGGGQRGPSGDDRSATLETAALFVRGAVRSVFLERSGGQAAVNDPAQEPEVSPQPAPVAPTRADERAVGDERALAPGAARSSRLAWVPRVGLEWNQAGFGAVGAWSIDAAFGLRLGRFSAGIGVTGGFPELVRYQDVELSLRRETLLAEIAWEALELGPFGFHPLLSAGAARFTRSSRALVTNRAATPDQTALSALVAFELVVECELGETLRLRSNAGVGWLSHVPRYELDAPPALQSAPLEAWRWQPNAGIALGAVF